MAAQTYKIEKGSIAVYVDPTNAASFDTANLKLVGAATSGEISQDVDEQELTFLGSLAPDWSEAEPTRKSWGMTVDALKLYQDAQGNITLDDTTSILPESLAIGQHVWIAFSKSTFANGFKYGKAFVKSIRESITGGENNTIAITFTGSGQILTYSA